MSLTAIPSLVPSTTPVEASFVLTQSTVNCSRAAALREVLAYSEAVTKELDSTLTGYSGHLETLFTSVQEVATQAQVDLQITKSHVVMNSKTFMWL